jgi:(2R)-ethylmalonyl-CoA mutase
MQQVLAFETDLLEYGDLFDGSVVVETRTTELRDAAWAELQDVLSLGGAFAAVDELKGRLVRSMAERTRRIEAGDQTVVGVNAFVESEPSPLDSPGNILTVDPAVEVELVKELKVWRSERQQSVVDAALAALHDACIDGSNIMEPSIALAKAGGTTGEWAAVLREVFGEYRAPTGVNAAVGRRVGELAAVADYVKTLAGGPPRFLVAKPGLDGHSNGAEQIAVAARDAGMEVVYSGIRLTPEQIVASARDEDPDVVGLSILSGSHLELVPAIVDMLRAEGVDAPVVVGGIIPEADRERLANAGVSAVYTPKDFELSKIMRDVADLTAAHRASS